MLVILCILSPKRKKKIPCVHASTKFPNDPDGGDEKGSIFLVSCERKVKD